MRFWKRSAAALVAALVLLTAGCSSADLSWAYRAGDVQPPIGVYLFYMVSAVDEAESALQQQHADEEEYLLPDYKQLLNEAIDGQTGSDFIRAEAARNVRQFVAIEQEFTRRGLSLEDSQLAYASNSAASSWASTQEFYEQNGIAESSIRAIIQNNLKRTAIFQSIYGEGGENAVPESELRDILARDYAKVDMMIFYNETGDDAEETPEGQSADDYLRRLQEGEDLYDLAYEQQLAQAGEENADSVEVPEPGDYSLIFSENMKGTSYIYSDELIDGALTAPMGEPVLVEDANYRYILLRADILEDGEAFDAYRDEILRSLKDDEFSALLASWTDGVTLEANQPALDRYQPAKLKI